MDIALALDRLVPGGDWQGSVTEDFVQRGFGGDHQAAFNAIRWNDARSKPTWPAMEAEWQIILAEPPAPDPLSAEELEQEITALKTRFDAVELAQRTGSFR